MFPYFPFLNKMCGEKVFDLIFCQFLEATVLRNGRFKETSTVFCKKNFSCINR